MMERVQGLWRPICPVCLDDLHESIPLPLNGTCAGCGSYFREYDDSPKQRPTLERRQPSASGANHDCSSSNPDIGRHPGDSK